MPQQAKRSRKVKSLEQEEKVLLKHPPKPKQTSNFLQAIGLLYKQSQATQGKVLMSKGRHVNQMELILIKDASVPLLQQLLSLHNDFLICCNYKGYIVCLHQWSRTHIHSESSNCIFRILKFQQRETQVTEQNNKENLNPLFPVIGQYLIPEACNNYCPFLPSYLV